MFLSAKIAIVFPKRDILHKMGGSDCGILHRLGGSDCDILQLKEASSCKMYCFLFRVIVAVIVAAAPKVVGRRGVGIAFHDGLEVAEAVLGLGGTFVVGEGG